MSMMKNGPTALLKLRLLAMGIKGVIKNINRYTNEMPAGRNSAAESLGK